MSVSFCVVLWTFSAWLDWRLFHSLTPDMYLPALMGTLIAYILDDSCGRSALFRYFASAAIIGAATLGYEFLLVRLSEVGVISNYSTAMGAGALSGLAFGIVMGVLWVKRKQRPALRTSRV